MLIRLTGGEVVDPVNGATAKRDVWIRDGLLVDAPKGATADETHDVSGCIVMAGAIDIHSHIGGGNVNTARLLLPEHHRAHLPRPANTPLSNAGWSTFETGMPLRARWASRPSSSRRWRRIRRCIRISNSPTSRSSTRRRSRSSAMTIFLLSLIRDSKSTAMHRRLCRLDRSARPARSASRSSMPVRRRPSRRMSARSRSTMSCRPTASARARSSRRCRHRWTRLGVPHPLHVHCNNLGIAGSADTAAATIAAAEGVPLHLAHLQFYGYGTEGKRKFSSAAARLAEARQRHAGRHHRHRPGDVRPDGDHLVGRDAAVFARGTASPKKTVIHDGDGNGGGIVPYRYKPDYYGSLQWAVGLELFLLITDPWRVFFTTDHPNGAPFTAYPELFELLMSRDARDAKCHGAQSQAALGLTTLASIDREYTLEEIAIMTRAAPAKLLGLKDRGHLGAGAIADIAVYRKGRDIAKMFGEAALVFKNGDLVVKDGEVTHYRWGKALRLNPPPDKAMVKRHAKHYHEERYGLSLDWFTFPDSAIAASGTPFAEVVSCGCIMKAMAS